MLCAVRFQELCCTTSLGQRPSDGIVGLQTQPSIFAFFCLGAERAWEDMGRAGYTLARANNSLFLLIYKI